MPGIEEALAGFEARIVDAQKSSEQLSRALKRLRQAAATGHISEIEKGLVAIAEFGREADAAARALPSAWTLNAGEHLAAGYSNELQREASAQGVRLFEKDGRLYAFPLILRIEPREAAVRIGKKLERKVRPKHLVRLLAAIQKRPQRFREDRFLALLYDVYRQVADALGDAVSLSQIHDLMTLLPGTDYPIEEFGRDLLLLDRQPDLRTKDGSSFDFVGSTLSKGGMKRITVYDEDGLQRTYIAIRFRKG
jgi:hypothetical protein